MTGIKQMHKLVFLTVFTVFTIFTCAGAWAQPSSNGIHKDETGIKRMLIVFPENNAEIDDTAPMITVDFSKLETPVDAESVTVTLNGYDVTAETEINSMYAMYRPAAPLSGGEYEVRVTAKNINRGDIEPLSWKFKIKKTAVAPGVPGQKKADRTTGRLSMSSDYILARYVPNATVDVSQVFREKEGMKLNTDLNFTNASEGRTLMGTYHRETQPYTDVEIDKWRVNYIDANVRSELGSAWVRWSDLTMLGAELNGITITKDYGANRLQFVSGRTQDPSTAGTFKQMTTGLRYDISRGKHTASVSALRAYELDDPVFGLSRAPARDSIISLLHEYTSGDGLDISLELAMNAREPKAAAATHNQAYRFFASKKTDNLFGEAEVYSIAPNFLPISEGSSKYLKSDREGYRGKGGYTFWKSLSLIGEYENYDTRSTDARTRRGSLFARYIAGDNILDYRYTKLTTTTGTISRTGGVTLETTLPGTRFLAETRINAGWFKINYLAPTILSETVKYQMALSSSFKDVLAFSYSFSIGNTDDLRNIAETTNRSSAAGANWTIIPFKLNWSGRYETLTNRGTSSDNQETRVKSGVKYVICKAWSLMLNWESIGYSDSVTQAYNYKQNIWRGGMEWNF